MTTRRGAIERMSDLAGKRLNLQFEDESYEIHFHAAGNSGNSSGFGSQRVPASLQGVLDHRGHVLAIVEMRLEFLNEPIQDLNRARVLAERILMGQTVVTRGVIVDEETEAEFAPLPLRSAQA